MKKVILVAFILILAVIPINYCLGTTIVFNDKIIVTIDINDAYYFAEDSDGVENDIASIFTLDIVKNTRGPFAVHESFYLIIGLVLPSGKYYEYWFIVDCVCSHGIHETPTIYFTDHATEPGWYLVELTVLLVDHNTITDYGMESFLFDPPGSTNPTEPDSCRIVF